MPRCSSSPFRPAGGNGFPWPFVAVTGRVTPDCFASDAPEPERLNAESVMLRSVPPVPNRPGDTPPSQRVAPPVVRAPPASSSPTERTFASCTSRASQINSVYHLHGFDGSVPVPTYVILPGGLLPLLSRPSVRYPALHHPSNLAKSGLAGKIQMCAAAGLLLCPPNCRERGVVHSQADRYDRPWALAYRRTRKPHDRIDTGSIHC